MGRLNLAVKLLAPAGMAANAASGAPEAHPRPLTTFAARLKVRVTHSS